MIPADFLAPATSHNPIAHSKHHRILLSNFFAQPEALAFGKTEEEVRKEVGPNASEALVKSKVFEGNRPTNSILFPLLTPATLGEWLLSTLQWMRAQAECHRCFDRNVRAEDFRAGCYLGDQLVW